MAGLAACALTVGTAQAASAPTAGAAARVLADTNHSAAALRTALTAAAGSRTFTSPASASVHTHGSDAGAVRRAAAAPSAGATIYASSNSLCTAPGTGTQASPYCSIQQAVDAASAGDTVAVEDSVGYDSYNPFTVSTSGITVVGLGTQAWFRGGLTIKDASDVTISNLMIGSAATGVQIIGSSGVTLDYDYVGGINSGSMAMSIDAASADVTVSRSFVNGSVDGGSAITVASGASNVTLAGDVIAGGGVSATAVTGLDVTGDTIARSCSGGVDVVDASTAVYVENDVFEDAGPIPGGGYSLGEAACDSGGYGWAPDITVDSSSSAASTADYNDFTATAGDTTIRYGWAGADYATSAALTAATGEGGHDLTDPTTFTPAYLRPNETVFMGMLPLYDSPAVGSANPSAPGELTSDLFHVSPYTTRGAIQFVPPNPDMALALSAQDTSAFGMTLTSAISGFSYGLDNSTGLGNGYPISITIDWGDGQQTADDNDTLVTTSYSATHTYAHAGIYTVTEKLDDGDGDTASNTVHVATAGSEYTAYGPVRVLDTRSGLGSAGAVPAGKSVRVKIGGNGAIPAEVSAVVVNVTAVSPSGNGFITAYPDGQAVPKTSNVNYLKGQNVPNLAIVPVGADGYIDFYNAGANGATVQVVADVSGYFAYASASGYTSMRPYRLVDTRKGTGAAKATVASGKSISVPVAPALPAGATATAVAVNITATDGTGAGVLTAYPDGEAKPTASNVNYGRGQNIANAAVIPVGSDGRIDIANAMTSTTGSADAIVDVVGYYSTAGKSAYVPVTPVRYLDTRSTAWQDGPLFSGAANYFALPMGLDDEDDDVQSVTGFVVNATVTQTTANGYLAIAPDPNSYSDYEGGTATEPTPPTSSTLNWLKGQTVPNLVQVSTGSTGIIDFWDVGGAGSTALILDVFGYYQNA